MSQHLEALALEWTGTSTATSTTHHRRSLTCQGLSIPDHDRMTVLNACCWLSWWLSGLVSKASDVRYLADYGDNVDNFLECVPSYLHAVPALQVGREGGGERAGLPHRLRE